MLKVKTKEKQTTDQLRRAKTADVTAKRWKAAENAAWEAVRGMWAGQKLEDALKYQRRIRKDRKLSW